MDLQIQLIITSLIGSVLFFGAGLFLGRGRGPESLAGRAAPTPLVGSSAPPLASVVVEAAQPATEKDVAPAWPRPGMELEDLLDEVLDSNVGTAALVDEEGLPVSFPRAQNPGDTESLGATAAFILSELQRLDAFGLPADTHLFSLGDGAEAVSGRLFRSAYGRFLLCVAGQAPRLAILDDHVVGSAIERYLERG